MVRLTNQDSEWVALICCRVSDKSQLRGSGLDSQEYRCRQHAEINGYSVEEVFLESKSGGLSLMERPAIRKLLTHLDRNAKHKKQYVVIFDDHKRFARETENHLQLRRILKDRGVRVEFLNFTLEDSPEGKFSETIFAAQAQLEREQNARQTRQKSRARVEQGYCVTRAPLGYRYVQSSRGGKELVPNEPYASIIRETLKSYANGRLSSQTEVGQFLARQPQLPIRKNKMGAIAPQRVKKILQQYIYAGCVAAPYLGVSMRKGKHEPLISFKTYERIQSKLNGKAYVAARKDIRADFPLRGAVQCSTCDTLLTAGWSKGKYKKYAYYYCYNKTCEQYGISIARQKIEDEFKQLLSALQPTNDLARIASAMFHDAWQQRTDQFAAIANGFKEEALKIEKEIKELVENIMRTRNLRVIEAYETRIDQLDRDRLVAEENAQVQPQSKYPFEKLFELAMTFLSNPYKIWDVGQFDLRRTVLELAFSEHLVYCLESGFRSPKTTLPFNALGVISGQKNMMVPHR